MTDLTGRKMYKVMSIWSQPEIIWDMITGTEIPAGESIYTNLGRFIQLGEWIQNYNALYKQWLYQDCHYIHDILNPVNQDMLKAIDNCNQLDNDVHLFLWFDVDRDLDGAFEWKYCPLSKAALIDLGAGFPANNRLISPVYPLVFPCITP